MAEKMKRRISKWDVAAELRVETVGHDSALPANVDDPCIDLTEVVSIKPILSMNVDGSEINQSSNHSAEVRNNNIIHSNDICEKTQYSEQFDLEGDCKDGFKKQDWKPASQDRTMAEYAENQDKPHKAAYDMPPDPEERHQRTRNMSPIDDRSRSKMISVDGFEINQSANHSGEVRNNNIIDSDDICEKTQYSEQFDLEGDCKDGFKKQGWEPASQDRTMAEYAENQDRPHKAAYDMSPGPEERHQTTSNMSPIDDRSRSHRKRSRSSSLSYDSRSRSWSRSRSPSYVSKQGSERWTDKGRMRGMTTACRAFANGNCRSGSECRYLHEGGGWRQIDRHRDAGLTDGRVSRLERERHMLCGSKESLADPREKNNNSREKLSRRHEEPYEGGWGNNEPHQGYNSNERCFDFTRGRCHRGAACRYIHHDASSDGGWSVRDESRGRVHDRRGGSASFSHRLGHQRLSDVPCKYFLRGHCVHGEGCKFYHQVGQLNIPVERSLDSSQHSFVSGGSAGNITSANASELQDQTAHFGTTNPHGENESGVSDTQPIDKQKFTNRSLCDSHPALTPDAHKETQPSEQQATIRKVCEELSANNPLPTISIAGQNAKNRGQSQFASQLLHAQNLAPNSSFHQFASPLPSSGQMQQTMHSHPQNGKNQFAALHNPPDALSLNANMQNHSANPSCLKLNPQNVDSRGQVKQNLPMLSHSGSNFNLNEQIQQNGPLIHNAQSQPDFSAGGQIQQNLASHIGHGHQEIIVAGDTKQILPKNVHSQVQSVAQNHLVVPQPSSNPHIFNSDDKKCQLTTKNNSKSLPIQIGQGADSSELKTSPFNSDNSITHKVVTSEQAAKITDLSASLAQFFGTTARNSQSSVGMMPKAFLNPTSIGSFATTVAPQPIEVEEGSQTNLSHSTPSAVNALAEKPKVVEKIEAHGINKEQFAKSQNVDAEGRRDEDSKKIKEAKDIRMFKCALVGFVKDLLKPKWKEGQLSKEAYKTIVKKVVDKVSGSLQGPNVPQTQEKIDLYLLNSKAKLSKLLQAYVEKFVNS